MKINEIFHSIDGEVNIYGQGRMSTFIRLQGCNLRCPYCDTERAQDPDKGIEMTIEEVDKEVERIGNQKVTITGGEPLLQATEVGRLIRALRAGSHRISIETNGTIDLSVIDNSLDSSESIVMDWKMKSSGHNHLMIENNVRFLGASDFIKFVCADIQEVKEAIVIWKKVKAARTFVKGAFSIVQQSKEEGKLTPLILLDTLYENGVRDVFLNFQLHKLVDLR